MSQTFSEITVQLREFIEAQKIFFVATAPAEDGHINVSPKGYDTFRVIDGHSVAYLDLTGSGVETIAHLRDNGRITLMFCAFDGKPNIVRLYGRGIAVTPGQPRFEMLRELFPKLAGIRSIIYVDVDRIADSCGFSVPCFEYVGERETLLTWAERKGNAGLEAYRTKKNRRSIDDLPGLDEPAQSARTDSKAPTA